MPVNARQTYSHVVTGTVTAPLILTLPLFPLVLSKCAGKGQTRADCFRKNLCERFPEHPIIDQPDNYPLQGALPPANIFIRRNMHRRPLLPCRLSKSLECLARVCSFDPALCPSCP